MNCNTTHYRANSSSVPGDPTADVWVQRAVYAFFALMLLANLTMVHALVTHDFSVKYVTQVGSRATPLVFTVVSLWSALEGSILFWGLILASYVFFFTLRHREQHARYLSLCLGVVLSIGAFFAFLIAGPANPFGAVSPVPPDGPGPNPLLQNHILMVIHPPMLYLGYVGMVIPFGIAVAALLRGEIGDAWTATLRRWTLIPWTFLSVGIMLGGWWAYAVLGWGGYWAWDPVENASLLPWLTATAFLHSAMVMERKRMFKAWTLSLGLSTFLLTILGTFMTRSGVFNSVHSFTQSPVGKTFFGFLAVLLILSIALLAARAHVLESQGQLTSLVSREASLLLNNILLTGVTFTVLLGTTYPLIAEAVRDIRVSVGEPYFNKLSIPQWLLILFLMGVGPVLPWGQGSLSGFFKQVRWASVVGVVTPLVCLALGLRGALPLLTFGLSAYVAVVTLREMFLPAWVRMRERRESPLLAVGRSVARARRRFGGYLVHLGIVVIAVSVAASSSYKTHVTGTLTKEKALQIGPYQLKLLGLENGSEPHRTFIAARFSAEDARGRSEQLLPRMNFYERSNDPIGTPAIRSRVFEDLYVSMLAYNEKDGTASINAWIFPMVPWLWGAMPFLVFGALIAAWPMRKRAASVGEALVAPAAETGRGTA